MAKLHLDTQTLIAAGVGLHLLASLAKTVLTKPKQKAQIDAIEQKLDGVLDQLQKGASS